MSLIGTISKSDHTELAIVAYIHLKGWRRERVYSHMLAFQTLLELKKKVV